VCQGQEAAAARATAAPAEVPGVLESYPILALPEFPAALEALAEQPGAPGAAEAGRACAEQLRAWQARRRAEDQPGYADWLGDCAITLSQEYRQDPQVNVWKAIELFRQAASLFTPDSSGFAHCLLNEGSARRSLAGLGVEPRDNLDRAVALYEQARRLFPPDGPDCARCLMNEGNARVSLAGLGVEPRDNLDRAVALYEQARRLFPPDDPDGARCLMNEGSARVSLAGLGVEPRDNLDRAVALYEQARRLFPPDSLSFARCMMNEGSARCSLAEL